MEARSSARTAATAGVALTALSTEGCPRDCDEATALRSFEEDEDEEDEEEEPVGVLRGFFRTTLPCLSFFPTNAGREDTTKPELTGTGGGVEEAEEEAA